MTFLAPRYPPGARPAVAGGRNSVPAKHKDARPPEMLFSTNSVARDKSLTGSKTIPRHLTRLGAVLMSSEHEAAAIEAIDALKAAGIIRSKKADWRLVAAAQAMRRKEYTDEFVAADAMGKERLGSAVRSPTGL